MSNLKGTKINQLLRVWPKGTVATSVWLNEQGISSLLKQKYQESGWVEAIGYGAVIRAGDTVDWRGALYALQAQLGLKIYVGGKSALELQGYGHFIKFGKSTLHFYTQERKKLPLWFTSHDWGEKLQVHKSQFLTSDRGGPKK